jgi:hypothetical protein
MALKIIKTIMLHTQKSLYNASVNIVWSTYNKYDQSLLIQK